MAVAINAPKIVQTHTPTIAYPRHISVTYFLTFTLVRTHIHITHISLNDNIQEKLIQNGK